MAAKMRSGQKAGKANDREEKKPVNTYIKY